MESGHRTSEIADEGVDLPVAPVCCSGPVGWVASRPSVTQVRSAMVSTFNTEMIIRLVHRYSDRPHLRCLRVKTMDALRPLPSCGLQQYIRNCRQFDPVSSVLMTASHSQTSFDAGDDGADNLPE